MDHCILDPDSPGSDIPDRDSSDRGSCFVDHSHHGRSLDRNSDRCIPHDTDPRCSADGIVGNLFDCCVHDLRSRLHLSLLWMDNSHSHHQQRSCSHVGDSDVQDHRCGCYQPKQNDTKNDRRGVLGSHYLSWHWSARSTYCHRCNCQVPQRLSYRWCRIERLASPLEQQRHSKLLPLGSLRVLLAGRSLKGRCCWHCFFFRSRRFGSRVDAFGSWRRMRERPSQKRSSMHLRKPLSLSESLPESLLMLPTERRSPASWNATSSVVPLSPAPRFLPVSRPWWLWVIRNAVYCAETCWSVSGELVGSLLTSENELSLYLSSPPEV